MDDFLVIPATLILVVEYIISSFMLLIKLNRGTFIIIFICLLIYNTFCLGLKKEQIHSVEMVGDATRIPIVQEKCKEVFGKD